MTKQEQLITTQIADTVANQSAMQNIRSHIIIIDGSSKSGKKTLAWELSLALLYNSQKTAIVNTKDSTLTNAVLQRKKQTPYLPCPILINRKDFYDQANNFDAVIIPSVNSEDELSFYANTYITLIKKDTKTIQRFKNNLSYINNLWELKKKIASEHKRSLNWVVCENILSTAHTKNNSATLSDLSKHYGFRLASPISYSTCYQNSLQGISSQDKEYPTLQNQMTYEDVYNKREITKLAEFIFS